MQTRCPNRHQLWRSWLGTTGCHANACPYRRATDPQEEIARDPHPAVTPSCGHESYVGWGPVYGCRTEGCEHYLPGVDVTRNR